MKTSLDDMRFRLPCYDKPRRCPGWAGSAWKYPKKDVCEGGSLHLYERGWQWRFYRHSCGTVVLPSVLRNLDPRYWWVMLPMRYDNWRDDRKWRKENK